jgi:hypothetical protein
MFNRTYNSQPKEDVLGGVLLAASVCWTIAALTFLPVSNDSGENQLATRSAAPVAIVQADKGVDGDQSRADVTDRFTA